MEGNSYEHFMKGSDRFPQNTKMLILLDPPYDSSSSYFSWNLFVLQKLCRHGATLALWFPCFGDTETETFVERVKELQLGKAGVQKRRPDRKTLRQGQCVCKCGSRLLAQITSSLQVLVVKLMLKRLPQQLPGSGMIVVNPPAMLEACR